MVLPYSIFLFLSLYFFKFFFLGTMGDTYCTMLFNDEIHTYETGIRIVSINSSNYYYYYQF